MPSNLVCCAPFAAPPINIHLWWIRRDWKSVCNLRFGFHCPIQSIKKVSCLMEQRLENDAMEMHKGKKALCSLAALSLHLLAFNLPQWYGIAGTTFGPVMNTNKRLYIFVCSKKYPNDKKTSCDTDYIHRSKFSAPSRTNPSEDKRDSFLISWTIRRSLGTFKISKKKVTWYDWLSHIPSGATRFSSGNEE